MTNPVICENLISQPSDQPGWSEWGIVDASGAFRSLYGLESALPEPSALYYLAASGVCEIKGKYKEGAAAPSEIPSAAPTGQPVANAAPIPDAVSTTEAAPSEAVNPVLTMPKEIIAGVVVAAVAVMVLGFLWSKSQRAKKSTIKPVHKAVVNPFGGSQDGNG